MVYEMNLQDIYFDKIKIGQKIYEVGLNDEERRNIDVGDSIVFSKNSNADEKNANSSSRPGIF